MKKITYLLLVLFLAVGCSMTDVIDKEPVYDLNGKSVVTDQASAQVVLNGVYSHITGLGNYSAPVTSYPSFRCGAMRGYRIAYYYAQKTIPYLIYPDRLVGQDWEYNYELINTANQLLEKLNELEDEKFEEGRREEMIGECHFMRAFAHFRLLRQFGQHWDLESPYGVVVRDVPVTTQSARKDRSLVREVYDFIEKDLNEAIKMAPELSDPLQANATAAKALKARLLLFKGDYANAVQLADEVITSSGLQLEENYADIFNNGLDASELIFARGYGPQDADRLLLRDLAFNIREAWGPSASYLNLIGDDPRSSGIYREGASNPVLTKTNNANNDLPLYFIRLGEMFLIKAEALARQGSYQEAFDVLADFRTQRGVTTEVPSSLDQATLYDMVFKEWWIEMAFENGHEFYAASRFDKILEMNASLQAYLDGEEDAFKTKWVHDRKIYGIPAAEIERNPMKQNPGYE